MFNCLQLWVIVESEQFLKSQTSPPSSRCALSPLPPESGATLLFSDSCFHAGFCKSSTVSVKGGYWKNEGKIRGSFAALHEVFKAVQMLTCSRERSSGKPGNKVHLAFHSTDESEVGSITFWMRLFVGLGFWCQCHDSDLVISIFLRHTISLPLIFLLTHTAHRAYSTA